MFFAGTAPDFQPPCAYLTSALLAAGHTEDAWTMTQKAKELGVTILSEAEFEKLVDLK